MYIPPPIKRRLWQAYLAIISLVGIVIWTSAAHAPDELLHVYALDIGQGDAIYMRLPSGNDILIDGGPNEQVLSELGEVMPLTDHEIDLVIATHNHSDHIGGLDDVLASYRVKEIWLSGALHNTNTFEKWHAAIEQEQKEGATVVEAHAGIEKQFGEVKLKVYYPPESLHGQEPKEQHDAMIVTKASYGEFDILLTGDAEARHEQELLEHSAPDLDVEVLKVGHHGSSTSTTEAFLKATTPKTAIISVGKGNKFGHPTPSTLERLKQYQAQIYRTDENGRVEVVSDGKTFWTNSER
ncbi:MBL fold metallo-hydrolase [Candidatus Berkelbacteria bacterium]|nr:MBL fold metallo-hydrolase [Candidatus Berkelbacteria bacterium]